MSNLQLTEEKIKHYAKFFELQLKARTGTLTPEDEKYLNNHAAYREYCDRVSDAITDLSYDIFSGKLSKIY